MTQPLVLFDFDGTLADTAPDLAAAANQQRRYRNLPTLPYEALRPHASHGARGLLKAALGLDPDDPDYAASRQQFLRDYAQAMLTHARLFDGVRELLAALDDQGLPWGIVTNKAEALTRPMVRHLRLEGRCGVLVCGDTTPFSKPHPEPLLHAAGALRTAPHNCVYIGDDERDIQAGKAAGMATFAAAYGYCSLTDPGTWGANALAATPAELLPLIRHWAQGLGPSRSFS